MYLVKVSCKDGFEHKREATFFELFSIIVNFDEKEEIETIKITKQ